MSDYDKFIEGKIKRVEPAGFKPAKFTLPFFNWQKPIADWMIRQGRAALFLECGCGKTLFQLEWCVQIVAKTGKPVLILAPLAVAAQFKLEAEKFGIKVTLCRQQSDVDLNGINVTNYDRLDKFDTDCFIAVSADEGSILKSITGKTRQDMSARFGSTPYRLVATATPSPNDFTELGQYADFLGVCTPQQMLATYFINDTFDTGTWRLKGHAEQSFWQWVSSWACCVSKPSDLGFSDEGFLLPPVNIHRITVPVDMTQNAGDELFRTSVASATALHAENRLTVKERCAAAAKVVNETKEPFVVWCSSNEESELLSSLIPDAVEVTGSQDIDTKEANIIRFLKQDKRVMVSKGRITGFGLNLQFCSNDIYVGLNHSWETYYQCGKRIHRFGQTRPVNRYIVQTDAEAGVMRTLLRKENQHAQMHELVKFTRENLNRKKPEIIMNKKIRTEHGTNWTMYNGDCVRVLQEKIKDESIGFSIFSPPFADLFTYSSDIQDMGNCRDVNEFIWQFKFLIEQITRVTMPGRLCAVQCGDLLSTKWKDGEIGFKGFTKMIQDCFIGKPDDVLTHYFQVVRSKILQDFSLNGEWTLHSMVTIWKSPVTEMQRTKAHGLLYKTLQSDSSKSRVGAADYLLVFRRKGENPSPIVHTPNDFPLLKWQEIASPVWTTVDQGNVLNGEIATENQDERHICPLQLDVIERALMLWSNPGDVVLSPFAGVGSEGYQSLKMKRKFIGAELKASYFETGCNFLNQIERQATML